MNAEQRLACIASFEAHFDGDWEDSYFRDERDQWQAAWNAAIEFQEAQNKEVK